MAARPASVRIHQSPSSDSVVSNPRATRPRRACSTVARPGEEPSSPSAESVPTPKRDPPTLTASSSSRSNGVRTASAMTGSKHPYCIAWLPGSRAGRDGRRQRKARFRAHFAAKPRSPAAASRVAASPQGVTHVACDEADRQEAGPPRRPRGVRGLANARFFVSAASTGVSRYGRLLSLVVGSRRACDPVTGRTVGQAFAQHPAVRPEACLAYKSPRLLGRWVVIDGLHRRSEFRGVWTPAIGVALGLAPLVGGGSKVAGG
jgi:hypothetical protein